MEDLVIKKTNATPAVILKPSTGKFQLVGSSWPENPAKFYEKIFDWFEEYFKNQPLPETVFELRIVYFNTASAKQIVKLLRYLHEKSLLYNVRAVWFYHEEDEEMKREAERYQQLLNLGDFLELRPSSTIPIE